MSKEASLVQRRNRLLLCFMLLVATSTFICLNVCVCMDPPMNNEMHEKVPYIILKIRSLLVNIVPSAKSSTKESY